MYRICLALPCRKRLLLFQYKRFFFVTASKTHVPALGIICFITIQKQPIWFPGCSFFFLFFLIASNDYLCCFRSILHLNRTCYIFLEILLSLYKVSNRNRNDRDENILKRFKLSFIYNILRRSKLLLSYII